MGPHKHIHKQSNLIFFIKLLWRRSRGMKHWLNVQRGEVALFWHVIADVGLAVWRHKWNRLWSSVPTTAGVYSVCVRSTDWSKRGWVCLDGSGPEQCSWSTLPSGCVSRVKPACRLVPAGLQDTDTNLPDGSSRMYGCVIRRFRRGC